MLKGAPGLPKAQTISQLFHYYSGIMFNSFALLYVQNHALTECVKLYERVDAFLRSNYLSY